MAHDEKNNEGFVVIENISRASVGHFENKAQTAYICVTKDKIMYNHYENSKDRVLYNKGHRTTIKPKIHFINILPQTVDGMPVVLGDDSGFDYNSKTDSWLSKNVSNNKIPEDSWQRASFVFFFCCFFLVFNCYYFILLSC